MTFKDLRPAVPKIWLIALAGLLWSAAGLMLCRLAYHWLAPIQWKWGLPLELLGVVFALGVHQLCFSRIAQKNITRLCLLTERTCIFAFQRWKSYLLIGLMITLGAFVRNLPIPKPYLAILYTTIGGALLLASLQYYGCLWRIIVRRGSCLPSEKTTE